MNSEMKYTGCPEENPFEEMSAIKGVNFLAETIQVLCSKGDNIHISRKDAILHIIDECTLRVLWHKMQIDFVLREDLIVPLIDFYADWTWAHEEEQ
jgi:hypothetical protein